MRASVSLLAIGLAAALVGCRNTPPPLIQVPVETQGNPYSTREHDPVKPLPPSATRPEKLNRAATPEEIVVSAVPSVSTAYLEAYDRVGRPRIMVVAERPAQPPHSIVPGDYQTLERVVRDSLAAGGQVAVVPANPPQKITEQQRQNLVKGEAAAMAEAGKTHRADVLVTVRVGPASAEREPTEVIATARNTRDGQHIATASATLPPPPQRRQIDFTGRLVGERLVDELANTWSNPERFPPPPAATSATQPATQP